VGLFGGKNADDREQPNPQLDAGAGMGDLRAQVDRALADAGFLDPNAPDHDAAHRTIDRDTAIPGAIAGLITAVRLLADHLDAK
jgi:hypothetical protein